MLKSNEIYLGECLELMELIDDESVDFIFSDLPYGTTKCKWDSIIDFKKLWIQYERIIKSNGCIALFAQSPFDKVLGCSNLNLFRYEWIWEKTNATGFLNANKMPMKAHENILIFYKKLPTFNKIYIENCKPAHACIKRKIVSNKCEIYNKESKDVEYIGGNTIRNPRSVLLFSSDKQKSSKHPTQKPLKLCEYFIKTYTNENDLVLDNCCGSGTIPLACKNLNRRFIGMEIEEKYYTIAKERIEI